MLLTIVQIVTLIALTCWILLSNPSHKSTAGFVTAVGAGVWAVILIASIL